MSTVYLGLGSNLGDRQKYLDQAIYAISKFANVSQKSSVHTTEPWGKTDQPEFLNQCIEIETDLPPFKLLNKLKEIEEQLGRKHSEKWGPREIDIDILLYGNKHLNTDILTIPHPYMHERSFVLQPLAEIAADIEHPLLNKTIADLAKQVS